MGWIQRPTVLTYADNRYFKLSSVIITFAILVFALIDSDTSSPYGGTVLGYTLGISSAILVLILFFYGFNKRCPPQQLERRARDANSSPSQLKDRRAVRLRTSWRFGVTLQGWLSAHIYLGGTLLVLATLHTGFRFSWSVHTLTYALVLITSVSGYYGLYLYTLYPRIMTQVLGQDTLDGIIKQIAELDELARIRGLEMPDDVNQLLLKSRQETRIGSNLYQMLTGTQRNCPTTYAAQQIKAFGAKYVKNEQIKVMQDLYALVLRKASLVNRARTVVMLKARMDAWLYLHVPFSVALMAALCVHVFTILFYW